MRKPIFGEANLGALVGAVVGAVGGLVAFTLVPTLVTGDFSLIVRRPILALLSWFISTPTGWVLGGQAGGHLGVWLKSQTAEIVGGVLGGLVPVALLALWGWRMLMS
jgi:hypothetical protein